MSYQTRLAQTANGTDRGSESSAEVDGSLGRARANDTSDLDLHTEPFQDHLARLRHDHDDFLGAHGSAVPNTEDFYVRGRAPQGQGEAQGASAEASVMGETSVTGEDALNAAPYGIKRACLYLV